MKTVGEVTARSYQLVDMRGLNLGIVDRANGPKHEVIGYKKEEIGPPRSCSEPSSGA